MWARCHCLHREGGTRQVSRCFSLVRECSTIACRSASRSDPEWSPLVAKFDSTHLWFNFALTDDQNEARPDSAQVQKQAIGHHPVLLKASHPSMPQWLRCIQSVCYADIGRGGRGGLSRRKAPSLRQLPPSLLTCTSSLSSQAREYCDPSRSSGSS